MNILIKVIVLCLSLMSTGFVFASENKEAQNVLCDQPVNPENVCLKLEGNTYHGELLNEAGKKLKVDIHFDKVTCVLTDPVHPNRDVFRLDGELNKHEFSIDHGNYARDCVTNYNKQIFDLYIETNDHALKLDYARTTENPVLCDAAFGNVLCVEVTDEKTNERYLGIIEKK